MEFLRNIERSGATKIFISEFKSSFQIGTTPPDLCVDVHALLISALGLEALLKS